MNNQKLLAAQQKKAKARSDAIDGLLRDLMSRWDGRQFVWWLLSITKHGQSPATNNALWTYFAVGEQNVGQQILARVLAVAPEGYIQLLKEQNDGTADVSGNYDSSPDDDSGLADDDDDGA